MRLRKMMIALAIATTTASALAGCAMPGYPGGYGYAGAESAPMVIAPYLVANGDCSGGGDISVSSYGFDPGTVSLSTILVITGGRIVDSVVQHDPITTFDANAELNKRKVSCDSIPAGSTAVIRVEQYDNDGNVAKFAVERVIRPAA